MEIGRPLRELSPGVFRIRGRCALDREDLWRLPVVDPANGDAAGHRGHTDGREQNSCPVHDSFPGVYRIPGAATRMPLSTIFNWSGFGANSSAVALSIQFFSTSCRRFSVKSTIPSW